MPLDIVRVPMPTLIGIKVFVGRVDVAKLHELFTRKPLGWSLLFGWPAGYDVSTDGNRFVVVRTEGDGRDVTGIVVLENWTKEFAK